MRGVVGFICEMDAKPGLHNCLILYDSGSKSAKVKVRDIDLSEVYSTFSYVGSKLRANPRSYKGVSCEVRESSDGNTLRCE